MSAGVFDGGDLKILVAFGVDVLKKSDLATNGDVFIGFDFGNFLMMTKINITIGEMIEKILVGDDFEAV